jgi:hypothetical protein
VTQPLLLEQLRQLGFDISAGELSRILTEGKDVFHQEKAELLPVGLAVSPYIQVDDTGARHQGRNGACTHIGNELFAFFASTESKSRLNVLEILRRPHTDYQINQHTIAYWRRQKLPKVVMNKLRRGPRAFPDAAAWQGRLRQLGITTPRHVKIATEGALLGSLIAHGVSPELVVLSDGAGQYDLLVHAACWLHAERPLTRLIAYSEEHRAAIAKVRGQIWEQYRDLKGYQQRPESSRRQDLEARFDGLCLQRTGFPSIDNVLKGMHKHRAALLKRDRSGKAGQVRYWQYGKVVRESGTGPISAVWEGGYIRAILLKAGILIAAHFSLATGRPNPGLIVSQFPFAIPAG